MFNIEFRPKAVEQLKEIKRYYAVQIINAIEEHLRYMPDKPSPPRIKILRGRQQTAYRLRAGDYRIFYDIAEETVVVLAILRKSETGKFYLKEKKT